MQLSDVSDNYFFKKVLSVSRKSRGFFLGAAVMLGFLNSNKIYYFHPFLSTEELNKTSLLKGLDLTAILSLHIHFSNRIPPLRPICVMDASWDFCWEKEKPKPSVNKNLYTSTKTFIKRSILKRSDCWLNENPLNMGYISKSSRKDAILGMTQHMDTQQMDGGCLILVSVTFSS